MLAVAVAGMVRVADAMRLEPPPWSMPSPESDPDTSPWTAPEPVVADLVGELEFAGDGGARIDLPQELVGGGAVLTMVGGESMSLYFPRAGAEPGRWPAFGGLLVFGSDFFGRLGVPVLSTTLWIGAEAPWRLTVTPLAVTETAVHEGEGFGVVAVPGEVVSATVRSSEELFDLEVVGGQGMGSDATQVSTTFVRLGWDPAPVAVIMIRADPGTTWRVELDGMPEIGEETPAPDETPAPVEGSEDEG